LYSNRFWLVLAALVLAAAPAGAAPDPFGEFIAKYRCPVADRLERLFDAGDPTKDGDRYLVVSFSTRQQDYVQCLFHDNETMVYCEAASGFWFDKQGAPRTVRLAPGNIAALARLGFSTDDSAGNFKFDRPVPKPPDFGALADLMLKALYDGYDARVATVLEFKAPFAPGLTLACDPLG
jgi:hypothetical protein